MRCVACLPARPRTTRLGWASQGSAPWHGPMGSAPLQASPQSARSEKVDSADCHIVSLKAKPKKKVAYDSYKMWIDKATFAVRKAEYFSRSGKKIKEMQALGIEAKPYKVDYYLNKRFYNMLNQTYPREISRTLISTDQVTIKYKII